MNRFFIIAWIVGASSCSDPYVPKVDVMEPPAVQIGNVRGGTPDAANRVGALLRKNGILVAFESDISFSILVRQMDEDRARVILEKYIEAGNKDVFLEKK